MVDSPLIWTRSDPMQPSNYLLDLPYQPVIVAIHEGHIFHLHHQECRYLQYLVHLGIMLPLPEGWNTRLYGAMQLVFNRL